MRLLYLFAFTFLLFAACPVAMANNGHNGGQGAQKTYRLSDPDSIAFLQQKQEKVTDLPEKSKAINSIQKKETKLPKEKGKVNSMSFNFLYYLFYKFSVTDFEMPDFNSGGSTILLNLL